MLRAEMLDVTCDVCGRGFILTPNDLVRVETLEDWEEAFWREDDDADFAFCCRVCQREYLHQWQ